MPHPGEALVPDAEATIQALRAAGACFAFVHGSRAEGTDRKGSDIDLAAWFDGHDPAPWRIGGFPPRVDLLVLDRAPLELAGRVALHGVLLFDDDPPARVRWVALTRRMYLDERPRTEVARRIFFEGVREREEARGRR
ncbi:MAG: nucleotidyltransferase domain-containing protein [Acidimicrobiales bacterium]|jgi:predicted nucleotidyltransferase